MYCRCLPLFAKKCVCVRARARLCVCLCVCVYDSAKILLARMVFINTVVLFSCWFVPAALSARLCVCMFAGGGVGGRECVSVCVAYKLPSTLIISFTTFSHSLKNSLY